MPNQPRFYTELHTFLVVSGAEFRVSFLAQVHTSSFLANDLLIVYVPWAL